jgi:monofunctional glycosyltransferase
MIIYGLITFSPLVNAGLKELLPKLLLVLCMVLVLFYAYQKWLRHIPVIKKIMDKVSSLFITLYIFHFIYLAWCSFFYPPVTITQLVNLAQGHGLKRDYIQYSAMGAHAKLAVIASEDQLFPDHDGFDIKEIKLAIKYNQKHPGKQRGGSTLSQQVAKNIFLWQHGGHFRKALEVYFTVMIEILWSKERILEHYLNIAEMGKGVFGIQAAARQYFKKDASSLTRAEAAKIAACLPNPKEYTVVPLSPKVANRFDDIVRQMNNIDGDADVKELIR